ncbi:hypothetical protein MJO28_000918 [Puccinia striiformis f. sp. tritici]|uniref:Uncharacterized protein n=1 Tax=Puccinia striiformis f. sp. tritici TaxID=168172 RepID=A0ACC0F148_9BASI|nr:hypothetical protein MJO28_000918 [Puccinia striiformis f. sp. tritici]
MDFDDDDEYDKEFLTRRVSFLQSRRLVCDGLPAKHLPRELPRCVFVVEVGPAREEAEAALAELPGSITSALDTATGLKPLRHNTNQVTDPSCLLNEFWSFLKTDVNTRPHRPLAVTLLPFPIFRLLYVQEAEEPWIDVEERVRKWEQNRCGQRPRIPRSDEEAIFRDNDPSRRASSLVNILRRPTNGESAPR